MPSPPLTDARLRAWGPDPGRHEIPDNHVPGLIARGEPSGNPTWHVRKRIGGKRVRLSLGAYPTMSLNDARATALDVLAAWHAGRPPVVAPRASGTPTGTATVAARLREWQDARDRDWSARHAAEVQRIVKRELLPRLGQHALRATTRADWIAVVAARRRSSPATASLIYRTVSAFLNFAEASGWIDAPILPRRGMTMLAPPPARRERVLSDEELRRIWAGSATLGPRSRALVRLLILTGVRLSEVADLDMAEIDMQAGRWTIPGTRTKNGASYTVPLCSLALTELAQAGAALRGFRGYSKLKVALDAASRVRAWRLHDLRRTARIGLANLDVSREIGEASINHTSDRLGLVGTYDPCTYALRVLDAWGRWQEHVAKIVMLPDQT